LSLEVIPVRTTPAGARHFLVLFEEQEPPTAPRPRKAPARGKAAEPEDERAANLERELASTRDYLQSIIEEHEAANEELKSANEEILSANEELQSTNEELETAKEELQSTNEELTTVNEELQNRNAELARLNNDLTNLLSSINIPILMLGSQGEIRRFTPQAEKLLNLIPTDVGRPLRVIKPNIVGADVAAFVKEVVDTVSTREREVQDTDGCWYLMRVRPYRTAENRIDGAVVAFLDIDAAKRSLDQVNKARHYAETLVDTIRESLVVLDHELRFQTANQAFYSTFQTSPLQVEGKLVYELPGWTWVTPRIRSLLGQVASENQRISNLEVESEIERLGRKTLNLNARQIHLPGERRATVLLAIEDITER
ncbi:MAG: PAS domain-containing protein, partial [Thermoanaerobaculia bacterium]